MTAHRLQFRPGGIIPPALGLGVRLRRTAAPTVETITETASLVTIAKTTSPTAPHVGENVTITITLENTGAEEAHYIFVAEALPAGYLYVSHTASVGTYADGEWSVGDLAASATATLEIVATVLPAGPYTNTASLSHIVPVAEATNDIDDEPEPGLPAGSDAWYESPNASVIAFQAYDGAVSELTVADDFTEDDDVAFEGDLPSIPAAPLASAWWQLTVPAGVTNVLLTADTWLTTGARLNSAGDGPADDPGDTNLSIYPTAEAPPLGPLPTGSTDFNTMTYVDGTDDSPDPSDPSREYTSQLTNVALTAGKVYWIRVDTWGSPDMYFDGITYRLRITLTYTP